MKILKLMQAKITIDKIKDAKAKTYYCKSGDIVTIYDTSRPDIWFCKNSKGEPFSTNKDNLIIIQE